MTSPEFPALVVGAVIFNPEGRVFLMKSHKWHDKYVIPGGHVELGERLVEAVHREVREETGLEVHSIEFLGAQESIYDDAFYKKKHFVFLDYVCKAIDSKVTLNSEGQEYLWTTIDEAMELPLGKYTYSALRACKSNLPGRQIVQEQPLNRKSLAQIINEAAAEVAKKRPPFDKEKALEAIRIIRKITKD